MRPAKPAMVPLFFLYGEPVRETGRRFLHVESLERRSRPANWTIQTHAHAALSQVIALVRGGGTMLADGVETRFTAPCVLLVPCRTVHGFRFGAETAGQVLTVGEPYLLDLLQLHAALAGLFAGPPSAAPSTLREARALQAILRQAAAENAWAAPGHDAALDALLTMAFVLVLRMLQPADRMPRTGQPDAALVARFRQLVEARFRTRPKLAAYRAELGVSESRLRRACLGIAQQSPLQIIQQRVLLEAKRMLLFTNSSSAEIAELLGFQDPAYFSRFFRTMTGVNARAYAAAAPLSGHPQPAGTDGT